MKQSHNFIYSKCSDTYAWENTRDYFSYAPASDQGLHCSPFIQYFLDMSPGIQTNFESAWGCYIFSGEATVKNGSQNV